MEKVFISLKKAKIYPVYIPQKNIILNRLSGGTIYERIKFHIKSFLKNKDFVTLQKIFYYILIFGFDGRFVKKFTGFSIKDDELIISEISLTDVNKNLYHWAPEEKLKIIKKECLIPSSNYTYVFITDDSDYIKNNGYLYYKTFATNKNCVYVNIEINTQKLLNYYKIYKTFRKHEFVVEKIPADCIVIK